MLSDRCIYTIKHSDDLRATIADGGAGTYCEQKKWARAKKLLDEAKRNGKQLPIVFAPAEGTLRLFAWAILNEVVPDSTTTYSFSDLRLFRPRPLKTSLRKEKDGQPLDEWFIRPYAICWTPDYLSQPSKRRRK